MIKKPTTARYLKEIISQDLGEKMIFIGGPRQVGKTTLALQFLKNGSQEHPAYLNWDSAKASRLLKSGDLPKNQPLIILDEIHKFARWRNLVKGFYDTQGEKVQFIVTGSARLDYYRRGGDSLQGRYHYYRLHPFSLLEMQANPNSKDIEHLLRFGGFPEPLFKGSEKHWRRWQQERIQRVLYGDLRDLERVREVSLVELLVDALPTKVGAPLSIKSLREDLEVAHESVAHWLEILERLYVCFRLSPFGSPRIRAVKKEQKLYFWDWSLVDDAGYRFENLVAAQLLKYCHFLEDTEGFKMELRFIRDTDKREIDFVVLKEKKPLFAVECKSGERALSPAIAYFKERTIIPKFFQVHLGNRDHGDEEKGGRILPFIQFCQELQLP